MDLTLERTSRPSLPGSMISSSISEGEKPDARRSMISSRDPKHSTVWPLAARNVARYSRILLSSSTTRIDRLFMVKVLLVGRASFSNAFRILSGCRTSELHSPPQKFALLVHEVYQSNLSAESRVYWNWNR